MTMTASKPKKTPKIKDDSAQKSLFTEQEKKDALEAKRVELIQFLQAKTMEVSLEVNWFAKNKKVDDNTVRDMLAAYAAKQKKDKDAKEKPQSQAGEAVVESATPVTDAKSVGMTKRLFSSGHPAVKAANEAKRALENYFKSKTMTAAAFAATKMTEAEAKDLLKKDGGTRFIEMSDIEQFDAEILVLEDNVISAVKAVNEQLPDIKKFDKEKLVNLYKEDDYPEAVSAQIRGPDYKTVAYTIDFQNAAPKAFARAQERAFQRLTDSVDVAVGDMVESLLDLCKLISTQLANRIRLKPTKDSEHYDLRDAEVVEIRTPDNDQEVVEGTMEVRLCYKPAGAKRMIEEWKTFTPEEYAALRPMETDERRKFYESSVENFRDKMEALKSTAAMLGDHSKPLIDVVEKLEDTLRSVGSTPKEIADEVRSSGFVRKTTAKAFSEAASVLAKLQDMVPVYKGKRRAIGRLKPRSEA